MAATRTRRSACEIDPAGTGLSAAQVTSRRQPAALAERSSAAVDLARSTVAGSPRSFGQARRNEERIVGRDGAGRGYLPMPRGSGRAGRGKEQRQRGQAV